MAKKDEKSDELDKTGRYEKNYYRATQNNSKSFWDRVDAAGRSFNKARSMARAYYGDKADDVVKKLNAYNEMGDSPNEKSIKNTAAKAEELEAQVLKDSAAGRKRLIDRYDQETTASKKAGVMKAKGGSVKSAASRRADGCAQRGKTRGKMI